jgi:hypothetical protein
LVSSYHSSLIVVKATVGKNLVKSTTCPTTPEPVNLSRKVQAMLALIFDLTLRRISPSRTVHSPSFIGQVDGTINSIYFAQNQYFTKNTEQE